MPAVHQVSLPPRYLVVDHIANGGMAAVWAAQDAVLERLVAVKTLAAGYAADPAARRRFTREARAAARVSDHPNVVTVFDIGDHEDQAFIVMEHFAGGTVADRLRGRNGERSPVPVATALRWLRQTASALDAAHAADIVHRDVKPGNLLLDETGRLAVGDFGIASIAGETQVTAAGQVLGTAAYLSPEQARGGVATPASDRYSLAVVAYELLCGRKPFAGETAIEQARARLDGDAPALPGPCGVAATALQHGLARDPADRPLSAGAFVDELERVLAGHGGADATVATAVVPRRGAGAFGGNGTRGRSGARGGDFGAESDGRAGALAGDEPAGRAGAFGDDEPGRRGRGGSGRFVRAQTPAVAPPEVAPPVVARTPVASGDVAPPVVARTPVGGSSGRPVVEDRWGSEVPPEPIARPRNPRRRAWAIVALIALCLAAGAGLALISDDGNDGGRGIGQPVPRATGSSAQPDGESQPAAKAASGAAAPTTSTPPAATPAPASTDTSAVTLNNTGYAMLPGNPQGAVPLLSQAVAKFRAAHDTSSIDYAYSLYNYGWALRLAGRPAEAIPYLQERLRISDYARDVVEKELKTAQSLAGGATTSGSPSGTGGTADGSTSPTASGAGVKSHGPAGAPGHGHGHGAHR